MADKIIDIFIVLFLICFLFVIVSYIIERGKQKKIGVIGVALIMIIFTPFIGYFIVEALPNHKRPCKWCGNKYNESEYCGICGKNEMGEERVKQNV